MGIFKAGLITAAGACALALVVGHGSIGSGFSRLGADIEATYGAFKPEAQRAMGFAGKAFQAGEKSARESYNHAPQAIDGMKASAKAAAVDASAKAQTLMGEAKDIRPLDRAASSTLARLAASGQSTLRQELFGGSFNEVDARASQAADALIASSQGSPSLEDAKLQSLRELGAAMLESSPTLRAAAFLKASKDPASKSKGVQVPRAQALAAAAFCDSFASALTGAASPEQASAWGLPSPKAFRDAGLPEPETARARWELRQGEQPVEQALEAAAREASNPQSWNASSMAKELGSESWINAKPAVNAKSALGEAQARQGSAFIFAAEKLGAPSQELDKLRAKLQAKRAAPAPSVAPAQDLGSAL